MTTPSQPTTQEGEEDQQQQMTGPLHSSRCNVGPSSSTSSVEERQLYFKELEQSVQSIRGQADVFLQRLDYPAALEELHSAITLLRSSCSRMSSSGYDYNCWCGACCNNYSVATNTKSVTANEAQEGDEKEEQQQDENKEEKEETQSINAFTTSNSSNSSSSSPTTTDEEATKYASLTVACHMAAAVCCSKLERWDKAYQYARTAVDVMGGLDIDEDDESKGEKDEGGGDRRRSSSMFDDSKFAEWRIKAVLLISRSLARQGQTKRAIAVLGKARAMIRRHHLEDQDKVLSYNNSMYNNSTINLNLLNGSINLDVASVTFSAASETNSKQQQQQENKKEQLKQDQIKQHKEQPIDSNQQQESQKHQQQRHSKGSSSSSSSSSSPPPVAPVSDLGRRLEEIRRKTAQSRFRRKALNQELEISVGDVDQSETDCASQSTMPTIISEVTWECSPSSPNNQRTISSCCTGDCTKNQDDESTAFESNNSPPPLLPTRLTWLEADASGGSSPQEVNEPMKSREERQDESSKLLQEPLLNTESIELSPCSMDGNAAVQQSIDDCAKEENRAVTTIENDKYSHRKEKKIGWKDIVDKQPCTIAASSTMSTESTSQSHSTSRSEEKRTKRKGGQKVPPSVKLSSVHVVNPLFLPPSQTPEKAAGNAKAAVSQEKRTLSQASFVTDEERENIKAFVTVFPSPLKNRNRHSRRNTGASDGKSQLTVETASNDANSCVTSSTKSTTPIGQKYNRNTHHGRKQAKDSSSGVKSSSSVCSHHSSASKRSLRFKRRPSHNLKCVLPKDILEPHDSSGLVNLLTYALESTKRVEEQMKKDEVFFIEPSANSGSVLKLMVSYGVARFFRRR